MESKYYAPSDDEFRIGFEFYSVEEIDGSINGPYTIKDCFDLEVQARNCWKNYSDILIKYLDKDDIESFLNSSEIKYEFSNGILKLKINNDVRFDGICKNVSELKRIVESIKY